MLYVLRGARNVPACKLLQASLPSRRLRQWSSVFQQVVFIHSNCRHLQPCPTFPRHFMQAQCDTIGVPSAAPPPRCVAHQRRDLRRRAGNTTCTDHASECCARESLLCWAMLVSMSSWVRVSRHSRRLCLQPIAAPDLSGV